MALQAIGGALEEVEEEGRQTFQRRPTQGRPKGPTLYVLLLNCLMLLLRIRVARLFF